MKVVSKWARGLIAALAGVGALGAASCDALQATPESPPPHERPPQFRQVTANLACAFPIVPERELFIRDLGVVNDAARTQWSGILPTGSGIADGAWSFGRLMAQMSGPVAPEDFVRNWLAQWETGQTVNGQLISARSSITPQIINAWPKRPNGKLDLTKSPMRLLAIVNRVDVRDLSLGSAGEGRFVYGVLDAGGNPLQFTVILEYDLPAKTRMDVLDWANRWHALGAQTPGSAAFNTALQAITDRFTARNAAPGRPNGSALNQLRTNEIALASPWQLREFHLDAATGLLKSDTVALTPGRSLRTSNSLAAFINDNTLLLMDGGVPPVPLQTDAGAFRGAFAEASLPWTPPGVTHPEARHRFALNTCNGCHLEETGTTFLHVFPRSAGQQAQVSGFVSGTTAQDPNGLTHGFNELQRRATDLSNLLCEDAQAPTAMLTSPDAGSFVRGTVTVAADTTDDVGVARVDFFDGTSLIGSASQAPFTIAWNTASPTTGTRSLTARAFDTSGNVGTSGAVSVTVDNTPPMIIPGPPKWNQNSFYFVRGTPTVSWSIVQSVSGVAVARIFQDSVLLTSLAGSGGINYFIHWDTSVLSDGRHTISLEATDRAGNVSSHSRFVDVDNTPPAYLAITAPYNGAQVSGVVTLSATGSDNMDLASIAFQVDGTTLTPFATTAPYTRTWNSTGLSGTHTIVAIAYDRAGNSARSAPVTVTVP
ncbi:Ig-like domain-containing protein [Corallococcus exiguus]|nr:MULTISPECIES: Ig-like domain-containing protein [Corallococcus]NNB94098.1 Ig-like domain-containing protein [Corallococcus exiguus]NPC46187.1 Ig-like domain-containing protein [Corallococcus exiguus]RKH86028.1 hypothetical protein D7X99_04560 [Corallococcus sp. AB032C]